MGFIHPRASSVAEIIVRHSNDARLRRVVAEIARRHARKKQGSESGTCVGYPDTAVAFERSRSWR